MIRKEQSPTSNALIGAGVLFLVRGILHWSIAGLRFELGDWIAIGGTAFLVIMGIWARWMALPPAIICLATYLGLIGLEMRGGIAKNLVVWTFHGSTLVLLVIALVGAIRAQSAIAANKSEPS